MAAPGGLRRHPRAAFEAILLACRVEIALRRAPFAAVLRQIDATAPTRRVTKPIPPQTFERAIALAYAVLPFRETCLKTSLVFLLHRRRRGLPGELRIGVQRREDELDAHAWIEDGNGGVLTDPQSGFSSLPPVVEKRPASEAND